uniref:Activator of basal transcription 1 n=1 Tax=Glossina morsitans morsitans TaxID=37546 RepID=D3TQE6_GLOMM
MQLIQQRKMSVKSGKVKSSTNSSTLPEQEGFLKLFVDHAEGEEVQRPQEKLVTDDGLELDVNGGLARENADHETASDNLPSSKNRKKRKKGIIYVSNLPKHMNVTRIKEILGAYGKIGRVYLQPEKLPKSSDKKTKKRKPFARHFTEGWIEFESKRVAKQIVPLLNNKQISTRKRSQFYDCLWSMKYLPRFKWYHLTERMNYEQAVYKQRLMNEVSQARKETTFFQNNLDKSELIKRREKKLKKIAKTNAQ